MNEYITRTILILFAQVAIAAAIGFLLWYFWRVYGRPYLQSWAISALFFCISLLLVNGLLAGLYKTTTTQVIFGLFAALTQNLHLYFVLVGSHESVNNHGPRRTWLRNGFILAMALSFLTPLYIFLPFAEDGGERYRIALRLATREFLTAGTFFLASYIIGTSARNRAMGVQLMATTFVLYALAHSYYFFITTKNLFGIRAGLPSFFGVAEIVLISWIGFGIIIWLLEDERNRLQKINKEMDSFLYSTSHDLRAPIASILGITNLARLEVKDEKSLEYVGMIENRVKKLDGVISDILQLSRSANSDIKYGPIDFNKLVAELLIDIKFIQGAETIQLKYAPHPDNMFFGDYNQMKIVLGNLLSNAVRYHRLDQPEPAIEVRFARIHGKVVIEVEDNGEGIALEHQDKIFEMFFRASTKTEGTGLGLYIVKEALNRVKGNIDIESEVGVGSLFRVTLAQG